MCGPDMISNPSIVKMLLGNNNKSDESVFLFDESIFIFLDKSDFSFGEKLTSQALRTVYHIEGAKNFQKGAT